MTKRTFSQALRRGLGSAIVTLKNVENKAAYRDILLRCCLRDISYDWQSEGTRGYYLYEALLTSREPEYYEEAIIGKFFSRCSDGLFYQLSAILYRFAYDGSEDATKALRSKYDYFASKQGRLRDIPYMHEGEQWDDVVCQLMYLDGFSAFKRYAEDVGRILLRDPGNEVIYGGWFEIRARDTFGEKRITAFFERNYERSAAVRALADTLKARIESEESANARDRQENLTVGDLRQIAAQSVASGCPRPREILRHRRAFFLNASDSKVLDLADAISHEEEESIKGLLLAMFWDRSFPLDISLLMDYAQSENELLASSAIDCLKRIRNRKLHDLAFQLLKRKGLSSFALALLKKNYNKADDTLIAELIGKLTVIPHHVQMDIGNIYTCHRSADALPILLRVYQKGDCAFCRHYIVKAMHHCGVLPDTILEECLYDSYDETRDFVKRLIKRHSSHSGATT